MNNCKKIYVVNEFNEENNVWDIKTIVIFRDGDVPIIENYDASKHLAIISDVLASNNYDFLNSGLNKALENGLINVISRDNNQEMSILSSEIIQEQIRYGSKEENKENVNVEIEEDVEVLEDDNNNSLGLSIEDRELAQYFRLAILRDNGQLPPVGLNEIEDLASVNERVAVLEDARLRVKEGTLSQEKYNEIYNRYRELLSTSIKNLYLANNEKIEEKEEIEELNEKTQFSDEDMIVFDTLMETIDLCRDARVGDEKFEIVIDKGLTDTSKREVRISLLNGFSRDSYTFEFNDGEVFDSYINAIIARASLNDKIVDLKQVPTSGSERIADVISLYTTEEENQVLIRYSTPKLEMVNVIEPENIMENIAVEDKNENLDVTDSQDDVLENKDFVRVTNSRLELDDEDRELAQYFRLALLRDNGQLPPVGLKEIERIASVNERAGALEEAKLRLSDGRLSQENYDKLYNTYREQLQNAIRTVVETKNESKEEIQAKRLALSKEDRELADYYRQKNLREKGQLNEEELDKLDELTAINKRVADIEKAIQNLNDGMLSKKDLEELNASYRLSLIEAIKEAAKKKEYENISFKEEAIEDVKNEQPEEVWVNNQENAPVVVLPVGNDNNNLNDGAIDADYMIVPEVNEKDNLFNDNSNADDYIVKDDVDVNKVIDTTEFDDTNVIEKEAKKQPRRRMNKIRVLPTTPEVEESEQYTSEKGENEKSYYNVPKENESSIDDSKPVQTVGKIVVNPEKEENVVIGNTKGKVRKTNKLKKFGSYILAGLVGIGAFLGINKLVEHVQEKIQHLRSNSVGKNDTIDNSKELVKYIMNYGTTYNVPADTMNFLMRDEVIEFLSQYKNSSQVTEVLTALCYGFEANILTTKDGNFRLDADGNTYLRAFASDFLCAKVVVNGYSPEQMLNVFGGTDMSYEKVMDGFKGYLNTVSLYGTTAVEPLPFRYLTNNDAKSTAELNKLFDKLSVVNANRKAGTLNSLHTDAFIVAVDEFFVQNDQSLKLSEGTKMVAAALVDGYMYSQAQVANGEALYLHADYGLAKAGLNLQEVDGHFAIVSKDRTAYHFTSLLDVINYGYGNVDVVNDRCLTEQQILFENLNQMNNLSSSNERTARITLANALYENNMKDLARQVADGNITESLLQTIELLNPSLADEIDAYEAAASYKSNTFVPFDITTNGIDELLGIKGLTNDYATLHNIRRNLLYMYDNYDVYGQRYVKGGSYGYGYGGISVPGPKVTVTKRNVKVEYDDLTADEKEQVQEQIEEHKKEEEKEHQEQLNKAEEGVDVLREAVSQGATQEQLEEIGAGYGIDVDDDYQENMSSVLEQQKQGEKLAEQVDEENAKRNEAARREAEERARREAEEQARRKAEQEALINGGSSSNNTSTGSNSAIDPGYVDTNAGEEPYLGDLTSELTSMKTALASAVDVESLGLDEVIDNGRSLSKSRNA